MPNPLLAWINVCRVEYALSYVMQDDCTYIHSTSIYVQAKWLHMQSLIYVGSYFSWTLPLNLTFLIFSILVFHVGPTIQLCGHSAYKTCPLQNLIYIFKKL
jgi:hypothetical protein